MKYTPPNKEVIMETVTISRESYDKLMDIELEHEAHKEELRDDIHKLKNDIKQLKSRKLVFTARNEYEGIFAGYIKSIDVYCFDDELRLTFDQMNEERTDAIKSAKENIYNRNLWQRIINKKN